MLARLSFAANLIPRNNVELYDHANQPSALPRERKDLLFMGTANRKEDIVAINFKYDSANFNRSLS